jgi:hypothetical protein
MELKFGRTLNTTINEKTFIQSSYYMQIDVAKLSDIYASLQNISIKDGKMKSCKRKCKISIVGKVDTLTKKRLGTVIMLTF